MNSIHDKKQLIIKALDMKETFIKFNSTKRLFFKQVSAIFKGSIWTLWGKFDMLDKSRPWIEYRVALRYGS